MYEEYIVPGAVIIFFVSFICGLNIGMMLMQHRRNNENFASSEGLYSTPKVQSKPVGAHPNVHRQLRHRDFMLDFGLP